MPRVFNVALAALLLACIAPVVTRFDGRGLLLQTVLVATIVPVLLLVAACLSSAARPGSLGRAARRLRARRRSR